MTDKELRKLTRAGVSDGENNEKTDDEKAEEKKPAHASSGKAAKKR